MVVKKRKTTATKAPAKKTSSRRAASSKTTVTVDMSETEGRTRTRIKPGDYVAKVKTAVSGVSPEKKTPQISVTYQFVGGKYDGKTIIDNYYLTKAALWRLRNALEAMGVKVPSKSFNIDLKKLVGKEVAITVDDEEYDKKIQSRVKDVFDASDLAELDEDDEELDEDDDEEDDEDTDEDDDDEDEEEDDDADDDDEDEDDTEDSDDEEEEDDDLDDVDLDDDDE